MRRNQALCSVAVTTIVALVSGCAYLRRGSEEPLPSYGATTADAEGLTPEAYKASLGDARLEKFIAMYRLLAQSEARARSLEARLSEIELAGGQPSAGSAGVPSAGVGLHAEAVPPPPPPGGITTTVLSDDQQAVLAALREELVAEREKRDRLEAELSRLRSETAAGPFERGDDAALRKAQEEIQTLKTALRQEGEARDELRRQYESLRSKVRGEGGTAAAIAENASLREQIARLKLEQEREIASLRQELALAAEREQRLKQELAAAEQAAAGAAAAEVAALKSDADALRAQLAEERQRSAQLEARAQASAAQSTEVAQLKAEADALRAQLAAEQQYRQEVEAKLKAAMRVSDLIFRMEKQQQ